MSNGKRKIEIDGFIDALADWASGRNIKIQTEVEYGLTPWGTPRVIDAVLSHNGKNVALKYTTQSDEGSAFKAAAMTILTAQNTNEIKMVAVLVGNGIPLPFKVWASTTGHAVREEDLVKYLEFFFGV
jgi:hypothetical protein